MGPSPWAPIGATCTIWTTLNPSAPKDDSCHVWLKSNHALFKKKMKPVTFYKAAHRGPLGPTLGTAMNNFCSSSNKVSTHYITWLFSFWIWRRRCLKFARFWPFGALPLGPHGSHIYYLNNFESPTPKDDSCHFWLKSEPCIFKKKMKQLLFTKGPQGPIGATLGTAREQLLLLHLTRYLHTTYTWLSFWIWRRRCCANLHGFGPLGPSPWAPMGATHTIWTTLNPLPLRMIPAKFG